MKKITVLTLCLCVMGMSLNLKSQEMTQEQKIWYAIGLAEGGNFKTFGFDFSQEHLLMGINDAFAGTEKMTQEEMQQTFQVLQQMMQEQMSKAVDAEKAKGKAFLDENKKKPGVIETASGLQYKVVTMGTGAKPKETDKVKVHYHGTLIDGTVFDSSVDRGEPIVFPLNQVIKGWTEGLQLMPVGSKFILYLPSDIAYGDRDAGPSIKGGSTLIFEVELIEINPAEQ